jgi:outer membrane protein OmpA-like peptidoglycan-associated protein
MRERGDSRVLEEGSFWPGVADSLLAALMTVVLLAFGGLVLFALNPESSERRLEALLKENAALRQANNKLRSQNQALSQENAVLRNEIERLKREPPIIELTDAQNGNFEQGKALITDDFAELLQGSVFPQLLNIVETYPTVDTIEIIGHTDNKPVNSARSNLDARLAPVLHAESGASTLLAGSNTDLGLMRAAAVRESWLRWLQTRPARISRKIGLRCYSAANAISPPGSASLGADERDKRARRIEIRFTKLKSMSATE